MIYVTTRQKEYEKQLTWLDIINSPTIEYEEPKRGSAGTVTRVYETAPVELLEKINVPYMIKTLKNFNARYERLFKTDKRKLYRHYTIPKKNGGKRPIDQPCDELQFALLELKNILSDRFGILYHTSAFAYVTGRCTTQEVRKHQQNKSNWFLKTDFSGFFPSTTLEFTMRMMEMIFPVSEVCKVPEGKEELRKALSLGFLNGGLPQGTKLSPFITNVIAIPMDHELFNHFAHKHIVYTRYADDIHISCVQRFNPEKTIGYLRSVLNKWGAPWFIKPEKTMFGTNKACSANWMLGLNLNRENNITVGRENKETFKAMTSNLMMDYKNRNYWTLDKLQHYRGLLSYYQMVEKEYFNKLIRRYEKKYDVSLKEILKTPSLHSWSF